MIHAMIRLALLRMVIHWLYYSLLESSAWQATLGKKALGLEVTDLDGNRIGFGRATGRFFAKIISEHHPLHRLHHGGVHGEETSAARYSRRHAGNPKVVGAIAGQASCD